MQSDRRVDLDLLSATCRFKRHEPKVSKSHTVYTVSRPSRALPLLVSNNVTFLHNTTADN